MAADAQSPGGSEEERMCRICFDGTGVERLTQPCRCRGTQGWVHEACLLRWRRLQTVQGQMVAAARCELCGARYPEDLAAPRRPLRASVAEVARVIVDTAVSVAWYTCQGFSLLPPVVFGLVWLRFGIMRILLGVAFMTVVLYSQGLRLSLLGVGQDVRLGLTYFGPPVEGLSRGMLLVAIGAGGIFRSSVLYVLEHNDRRTLAVILNGVVDIGQGASEAHGAQYAPACGDGEALEGVDVRMGGPVGVADVFVVHSVPGLLAEPLPRAGAMAGARQAAPARGAEEAAPPAAALYLSRFPSAPEALSRLRSGGLASTRPVAVAFKSVSTWGERQLEGEVRRGVWGWVEPEHVDLERLLRMKRDELAELWHECIRSPHCKVFVG